MARVVEVLACEMAARVGLLADVADAVSAAGVDILGVCAYEMEGAGDIMLVAEDSSAAKAALEDYGAEVVLDTAVAVEMADQPGTLARTARKLADAGINIEYVFGSGCGGSSATIIFKTNDDEAAADVLRV